MEKETEKMPKPMILLDDKPILWHIMNSYSHQGFNDFVIATGYKSEIIEKWVNCLREPWIVHAEFTGISTQTGGRIKQVVDKYGPGHYLATYGDGLGNININNLLAFHHNHKKVATLTAVRPPARFGYLALRENQVVHFGEKSQLDVGWINGGFFTFHSNICNFIDGEDEPLETGALQRLTTLGELMAFRHHGFWMPMDTRKESEMLMKLSQQSPPPWILM